MKPRPFILLISMLCMGFWCRAQFITADIGVNGLTCSQCSRTVEVSLRKLDFVADVEMNLEHTEGTITFKPGRKVDMSRVGQAVIDAGFSLRYLQADMHLDSTVSGHCFYYKGDEYTLATMPDHPLSGTVHLRFIGKKYESKSEYKKETASLPQPCNSHTRNIYFVSNEQQAASAQK